MLLDPAREPELGALRRTEGALDLPDLFGPAREIVNLGARIFQIDDEGILIRPVADWFRLADDSRW